MVYFSIFSFRCPRELNWPFQNSSGNWGWFHISTNWYTDTTTCKIVLSYTAQTALLNNFAQCHTCSLFQYMNRQSFWGQNGLVQKNPSKQLVWANGDACFIPFIRLTFLKALCKSLIHHKPWKEQKYRCNHNNNNNNNNNYNTCTCNS